MPGDGCDTSWGWYGWPWGGFRAEAEVLFTERRERSLPSEQENAPFVVLVIESHREEWQALEEAFGRHPREFIVRRAVTGVSALRALGEPPWEIDSVVLDCRLVDMESEELLDKFRAAGFDRPIVLLIPAEGRIPAKVTLGSTEDDWVTLTDFTASPAIVPRAVLAAIESRRRADAEAERHELLAKRDELLRTNLRTVEALGRAIDARDPHSHTRHLPRLELYAVEIGKELGLDEVDQQGIWIGALLHDIGKLGIPDYVLAKPGRLTDEEFEKVKEHPDIGARILEPVGFPWPVAEAVRAHHERFDGSGYPRGLVGGDIPRGARILAVADVFDALTSPRPYRPAMTPADAHVWIISQKGKLFDPQVVEAFVRASPRLEAYLEQVQRSQNAGALATLTPAGHEESPFSAIFMAHQELLCMYEMAQSLGEALSLTEATAPVVAMAREVLDGATCAVYLERPDGTLELRAADGSAARYLLRNNPEHFFRLATMVFQNGEAILTDGLGERLAAGAGEAAGGGEAMAAPLLLPDGACSGVLLAIAGGTGMFTADHLRVLRVVAQHAAVPLGNARTFDETQASALTDEVTGLPNCRFLSLILEQELALCRRAGRRGCLLYIDIDKFKGINDRFGHPSGDEVLRRLAGAFVGVCRAQDTVGRYYGDEFVIVLRATEPAGARQIVQRLRQTVAGLDVGLPLRVPLGCSIGIASFPAVSDSVKALIAAADAAMYREKRRRRRG